MCGITGFWARESIPDYKYIDQLFQGAENRGQDGFGAVIIKNYKYRPWDENKRTIASIYKSEKPYHEVKKDVYAWYHNVGFNIGSVILGIARAAPETEVITDKDNLKGTMQPIYKDDVILVHNGAVNRKVYMELGKEYKYTTYIDSEAIIAAYLKFGRNPVQAFEYLSGGFATIFYDMKKDMLYVVNDHMPIAHGYLKGVGFFLHSDCDVIRNIIFDMTGCRKDGVCVWEMYYAHYLDGGAIRQIDLDSGFMCKMKYTPRYIVGDTFDSTKKYE